MTEDSIQFKISKQRVREFRGTMLDWYGKHKRPIPWRTHKRQVPDPYKIWLSEIMCQQTTVQAVIPYYLKFTQQWPAVQDLAAATKEQVMDAWAGLGYYSRARNLHACANIVANDYDGQFPVDQKALKALPGIGDYTAAAITAMAFDTPANVVDGNVERIMARYFAVREPLPAAKVVLKQAAGLFIEEKMTAPGDYAQSLMDLGAMICTPKSPKCDICPVQKHCRAQKLGIAADLPMKAPKKKKPKRRGYVYWIQNKEGQVLFHRRPEKNLLGGAIGLPTTQWKEGTAPSHTFTPHSNQPLDTVHHSFTHFDLQLDLMLCGPTYVIEEHLEDYFWLSFEEAKNLKIPTVFQKALKIYLQMQL